MKRLMISPSFLSAQRWFFKKRFTKGWTSYFPLFFCTFLSVSKFDFAVGRENFYYFLHPVSFFPTCNWSQPDLRSILTRSPCFVSWKFLILLMQTEMLSSAVHHALGSRGWAGQLSLFFIYIYLYIFLTHLPDSEKRKKRGKRNPLNPWMDSHQRHVRLRERQKGRAMDTGGDVGERCFGGGSGSRRAKLLEWNDEKQEIRGDKIRRWDSSMHLITKKERREGKVMEAGSGKGVWRCVRLDAIEAYLC